MDELSDLDLRVILIKKQSLFSQLTDDEVKELASLLIEQKFKPSETIVKEGDAVDSVYLIASGTADVRVTSIVNGEAVTSSVAILSAGDAVGLNETGFYSLSGKRTATVTALTEMVVYYLSVAAFHGFSLTHSHVSEIIRQHNSQNDVVDEKSP